MFTLTSSHQFFVFNSATDMRKGFDSLCGLVSSQMGRDPLSGEVFIFVNKPRNKVKLLHWEQGGFVLYYKRLELGSFRFPAINPSDLSCKINWADLVMVVEGVSLKKTTKSKRYILS